MRRMFSLKQLEEIADSRVQALVEGGTLENAKPIYFHGLDLYKGYDVSVTAHVLNSSSDPINTLAKFIAWAESIPADVNIQCNGNVKINDVNKQCFLLIKSHNDGSPTWIIRYRDDTGSNQETNVDLNDYFDYVFDGVNKIN